MALQLGNLGDLAIELSKSAAKIRKELVYMPVIGCKSTLQHMTLRPGLRSNETVGQVGANIQFRPYSSTAKDQSNITINPRTLEVFMGSVMKEFDPNEVAQSIWGSDVTKGPGMTRAEIVGKIVPYLMGVLGKNLNASIWSASRNSAGTTTATLFNGFDTITAAELAASTPGLSSALGNYVDLKTAYSTAAAADGNMVDFLQGFVQGAADELQGIEIDGADAPKLFLDYATYNKYNQDYAKVVGVQVYNKEYTKRFVEGTNVELVPLVNKKGSKFLTLSTKSNMLVGCNQQGEEEQLIVEKVPGLSLMLSGTLFWGTQFESVSKERLYIGQIKA